MSFTQRTTNKEFITEQRLLTDEEYQRKEQEKRRKQMEHEQAIKDRVAERLRTNAMPNDWDDESEKIYQERLAQAKFMVV